MHDIEMILSLVITLSQSTSWGLFLGSYTNANLLKIVNLPTLAHIEKVNNIYGWCKISFTPWMLLHHEHGIEVLCGIAHIVDENIMKLTSCAKVLGHSNLPIQVLGMKMLIKKFKTLENKTRTSSRSIPKIILIISILKCRPQRLL